MKILSITAQKPHSTGSGTYLTELVNSFARQGIDQAVVAGIYRDDCVSFPDGVQFFPVFFSCAPNAHHPASDNDVSYPIVGMSDVMPYDSTRYRDMTADMIAEFETAFMKQISLAVEVLDPDIILCHHLFLLTSIVRRNFPDRKVYGVCHGTDLRQMHNCLSLAEYVRQDIQQLDGIFALHQEQAEDIASIHNLSVDRIEIIGSGYNDRLFNMNDRIPYCQGQPVRICYAGKISRAKGVPELLDVIEQLHQDPDIYDFVLTLAGGCKDEYVREYIKDLPDYIQYSGQIPQAQLAELFKSNDIFVLPSFFEGLNLATIEAMASGLVPICTDLPGMKPWIADNVANDNVRYIGMPEMRSIDEPTEFGRKCFIAELKKALGDTINEIAGGVTATHPDTSGITWDRVAASVISF